jgi:AhpD family alkylhydroperoxidase
MTRLDPFTAAPDQMKMLIDLAMTSAKQSGLEPKLQHLVKIRASQINGCALCLHMHIGEGRKDGETDTRMYLLDAWREAPIYTARERAALAWTEAVTLIAETRAPDDVYADLKAQFTDAEMVSLTMLINVINNFNRISVAFRRPPMGLAAIAEAA